MQNVKEDRNKYIGGSDIPIIMGISPFKTRFDLLLEKAELKEDDFEGNEYTEYGNLMEPKIRDHVNKMTGKEFIEGKHINEDIRCHTDGETEDTILEIKTTSQLHSTLDEYKIYLVQLLFYMQETKRDKGILAVYYRTDDFNEEFNPDLIQLFFINDINEYGDLLNKINKSVEQFRIDLQKVKENPLITEEDLMPADLTVISDKLLSVENQLVAYNELTKQQKELKDQLKKVMEEKGIKKWTTNNGVQITLIPDGEDKEIQKFNEDKFKEENKNIYDKYLETKIQKGKAGYVKITLSK